MQRVRRLRRLNVELLCMRDEIYLYRGQFMETARGHISEKGGIFYANQPRVPDGWVTPLRLWIQTR